MGDSKATEILYDYRDIQDFTVPILEFDVTPSGIEPEEATIRVSLWDSNEDLLWLDQEDITGETKEEVHQKLERWARDRLDKITAVLKNHFNTQ